jgi:indolepyruvate ferredoxin oxidoreductase
VPDEIRGYGHVKDKSVAEAKALREQRAQAFRNPQVQAQSQLQPGVQPVAA